MLRTFNQNQATGAFTVNPNKLYVQPYWLLPTPPGDVQTIAGSSMGAPIIFTGPQEGPFEASQFVFRATSPANLLVFKMEHARGPRALISGSILANSMIGGQVAPITNIGISPYYLPQTLWLLPRETLVMQFQNLSADPNIVRCALVGRMFSTGPSPQSVQALAGVPAQAIGLNQTVAPFFYTTISQPISDNVAAHGISALAQVNTTIQIAADGAFELVKISGGSTGAFTLDIFDANTKRRLTSSPIHSDLLLGTGILPNILPESLFEKRNGWLQLTVTDLSGQINDIYLTFAGRRIYAGDENLP